MKALFAHYPNVFDAALCDEIITLGGKLDTCKAEVGEHGRYEDSRRADIAWAHPTNKEWLWVRNHIQMLMIKANAEFFDVDCRWLPALQFTTYDEAVKGCFDKHLDNFFHKALGAYDRKLSAVLQLSDPDSYEGGYLALDLPNEDVGPAPEIMRQRGSVIVFPSFVYHEVSPVTKGRRHSLVAWMEGPQWR